MSTIQIRPYTAADRQALRTLACETADRGEPVERFFGDRETFADLVTRYYTDYEPRAVWVAEAQQQLIGYLTGCFDTRRYHQRMTWPVVPSALVGAMVRGALWSRQTWRIGWASLATWQQGGWRRTISFERFPAHLHLNIDRAFRGQQIGHRLIEHFSAQAKASGVAGIHVAVRADNVPSCRFFEGLGFTALHRYPVTRPEATAYIVQDSSVYAKSL